VTAVEPADIIVQCTSVGLRWGGDPFKHLPLHADTFDAGSFVVDMVYSSGDTSFLAAARSRGAYVIDGSEILIAQGAASLGRWTGRIAPRDVMRRAVDELKPT
jgi:shikimate dehydrogenase